MANKEEPTVLIVGAGVFGASTAFHLSRQYNDASRITVIDRTAAPPTPAASTDINKIIRADYSSKFYSDLAYEAMDAWANWPELRDYYHRTGWIALDTKDSTMSEDIRKVFRDRGHDPTKDIPLEDLDKHWKGILKGTDLKGFSTAYWNPEAGWCNAAAATASMMNAAISRGVGYVLGDISSILIGNNGVTSGLTADGRKITADKFILATGAWTSGLLSPVEDLLQVPENDRAEQQVTAAATAVSHYKMSPHEMQKLSEMPVVVYGHHGEVIPPPPENRLLKNTGNTYKNTIVTRNGQKISLPPAKDQLLVPEALKRENEALMDARVMPTFTRGKKADYWRLCWDSRTPTQDWLLTQHPHPRLGNLYLATGGSFHSYKFLPIIGKYMANVLSGKGNGAEKDRAWRWKTGHLHSRGAHESTAPQGELRDFEPESIKLRTKL